MVIEKFDAHALEGEMYGLTFDLDTKMLEDDFDTSRHQVYSEIEKKLVSEGFSHVQCSVYFYTKPTNAMDFTLIVRRVFSTFRYAQAIRDLQGFEVKNWSSLASEIHEGNEDAEKLGKEMWP